MFTTALTNDSVLFQAISCQVQHSWLLNMIPITSLIYAQSELLTLNIILLSYKLNLVVYSFSTLIKTVIICSLSYTTNSGIIGRIFSICSHFLLSNESHVPSIQPSNLEVQYFFQTTVGPRKGRSRRSRYLMFSNGTPLVRFTNRVKLCIIGRYIDIKVAISFLCRQYSQLTDLDICLMFA